MYDCNLHLFNHTTTLIKPRSDIFLSLLLYWSWSQWSKRWKTKLSALVKSQLQNNITDDESGGGGGHRFMSSYEAPEANSVFVFSLTNGS